MGERDGEPTPETESNALIGSTLGGFRLTSLLGTGGMADVYHGYDLQLQRDVAVKVLPERVARDPRYVARFRSEAQRVAALNHPNVVPVFHFGEERGLLYLVMPVLKESLRDRMSREGTIDPVEAVFMAVEVAQALDAAHSQGVVHRDVKPENVLLNDEGRPLLSDFGIAREVEVLRDPTVARTLATTGMPVGTPAYMAPELLRGAAADHRVDVYGLGAVLYEMLTGRLPHEGVTAFDVAARALTEVPLPPSNHNPAIWSELEDVVLGTIASDPDRRCPDMSSLVEALRMAVLARGSSTSMSHMAAPPVQVPDSMRSVVPVGTGMPHHADLVPIGGAQWDRRGSLRAITDGRNPRMRRRALLTLAAAVVLLLVLGVGSAGGVIFALHSIIPATTAVPTMGLSAAPSATVANTPTVAPTRTRASIASPAPTATPLLTPTMVVSASPLRFQPYPSPGASKFCRATQTLTNISAVDAHWSWSNSPGASGWQYNTSGFNGIGTPTPLSGFPPSLYMTTPAHSSVYVYIQTGYDSQSCTAKTLTAPLVATITVTGGMGTQFNVYY